MDSPLISKSHLTIGSVHVAVAIFEILRRSHCQKSDYNNFTSIKAFCRIVRIRRKFGREVIWANKPLLFIQFFLLQLSMYTRTAHGEIRVPS